MILDEYVLIGDTDYAVGGMYSDKWIDDSFDHEFGIEKCGHYELDKVEIDYVAAVDQDGGEHEVAFDAGLWARIEEELLGVLI